MGFVKPRATEVTTGEAKGVLAGAPSASSSSSMSAVMRTDLDVGNFVQPSRAGLAVVEAEKKKKSAMEVDKMLTNLRARPHRTMDVDKLLDKLKKQRIDKEKEKAQLQHRRDSSRSHRGSFGVEMVQDGETVTDARSLWKKAVQSGEGNEIYKAIAAMNALSEVQLPTGESNTCYFAHGGTTHDPYPLGIDRELLNGLAHNRVRSVNLTCAEPPLGDNSITVLAYAVMKSTSVVTLNIGGSKFSPEGCRELGHMLTGNSSLQTLDCTDCGITDEGAIELGRTLYLNGSLRHMNLGFNRIGHVSVAIISQSLRMGTHLRSLDLSHNPLGDKGAEILAQSIVDAMDRRTEPWQLRVLHLNNCGIGDSGATALAAALKRCDTIEKMYLNFNPISIDGAIELSVAAGPQEGGQGDGGEGSAKSKSRVQLASGVGYHVPMVVVEGAMDDIVDDDEDIITVKPMEEEETERELAEGEAEGEAAKDGEDAGGGGGGGLAPLTEEEEEEEEEGGLGTLAEEEEEEEEET